MTLNIPPTTFALMIRHKLSPGHRAIKKGRSSMLLKLLVSIMYLANLMWMAGRLDVLYAHLENKHYLKIPKLQPLTVVLDQTLFHLHLLQLA